MAPPITCDCGTCQKCKWRVYMRNWSRRNADRVRQTALASRERRIEYVRAYDRARGRRYSTPEKESARQLVSKALVRGDLVRQPCEVCGSEQRVHAHHDDYAKPLEVRWLCSRHHGEVHRTYA